MPGRTTLHILPAFWTRCAHLSRQAYCCNSMHGPSKALLLHLSASRCELAAAALGCHYVDVVRYPATSLCMLLLSWQPHCGGCKTFKCDVCCRRQISGCKQMRPKRWCLTVVCRLTHLRSMCALQGVMPSQMLSEAALPRSKQLTYLNTAGMRKKMTSWATMTSLLLSRKRRREVQGRAQPEGVFESSSRSGPLQAGT